MMIYWNGSRERCECQDLDPLTGVSIIRASIHTTAAMFTSMRFQSWVRNNVLQRFERRGDSLTIDILT